MTRRSPSAATSPTLRLLLGSGGLSTPSRLDAWRHEFHDFLGPVARVLFIPYALADHDGYTKMIVSRALQAGREIVGIHRAGKEK